MTHTAKHTPGPWIVHTFTISGKEKLEVLDATGTNACVQANAHLIAAAPAMYEALLQFRLACDKRQTREVLHTSEGKALFAAYELAGKALAQAEGVGHE